MLNAASFRRAAVLFSLIVVLAVSQVSAAGLRPSPLGWLDRALSVLRLDVKAGCHLDPNGSCVKEGCHLDPDGRCSTSVTQPPNTKIGCVLDPNGRCLQ
jgi:hypothetical protein